MSVYSAILAGGNGTRLWPISNSSSPKQFWRLSSKDTMLQEAFKRNNIKENNKTYIVSNADYATLINEQLSEIKADNYSLVIEPEAKNTAPAITAVAQHIYNEDPEAILIVAPSDHKIKDVDFYQGKIREAIKLARQGYYIAFGVPPHKAEVNFGYIKQGKKLSQNAYAVEKFAEKPIFEKACEYFKSGNYYWNSGIFILPVASFLKEISSFEPEMTKYVKQSVEQATMRDNYIFLSSEFFSQATANSIDYAFMEKTKKAAFIKYDSYWNDMGVWNSIWEAQEKDRDGNVLDHNAVAYKTKNSLVISQSGRKIAALGVENITIIDTVSGLLVANTKESHEIKNIVSQLNSPAKEIPHSATILPHIVYRPWGRFENKIKEENYAIKKIIVNPGQKLSLQYHNHRSEHWVIIHGKAEVEVDGVIRILEENEHIFIPKLSQHRLTNIGNIDLELIELQFGDILEESDIVRLEDIYGRAMGEPKR